MKFRTIFNNDSVIDISFFSKYIIESRKEYTVIEFDENDRSDVIDTLIASITDEEFKNSLSSYVFDCIGDDNHLYIVSEEGFQKQNQKISFSLTKIKIFNKIRYNNTRKNEVYVDKKLESTKNTETVQKQTMFKFQKCEFISKENGIAFSYRLKPCKNANKPLVIFFHGGGGIGVQNFKHYIDFISSGAWNVLKKYDCTVLLPQAPFNNVSEFGNKYNYIDAVKQLSEIIANNAKANKNRIYIFGTSFGGHCTWMSAYKFPDYYACAMPVMGSLDESYFKDGIDCNRLKNIPLWVAHSSDDNEVGIKNDDKWVSELQEISANVKYTRWDKYGHKMSSKFYQTENWAEWMFNQSLDKR